METPRFDPKRRRTVTLALVLVTALASFESTVVSTAMPTIIGDLGGLPLYSWVFSIYLLTATVMMPIYGRLADIYGRRRILLVAITVFLVGAVACGLARSMPQLIAARGLQGLGAAGLVPIALTVSGDLFSLEERARVQGLFSSVWGTASLVGPLLGAWMTMSFGWRSIFTINIPLGLVAFALVGTQMIESRAPRPDPLRPRGGREPRRGCHGAALRGAAPAGRGGNAPAGASRPLRRRGRRARPLRAAPAQARASADSAPPLSPHPHRRPLCRRRASGHDDLRRGHLRPSLRPGRPRGNGRRGRGRRHAPGLLLGGVGHGRGAADRPVRLPPHGALGSDPHPRRARRARGGRVVQRFGSLDFRRLRGRGRGAWDHPPWLRCSGCRTSLRSGSAASLPASSRSFERSAAPSASARSADCSPRDSTAGLARRRRRPGGCSPPPANPAAPARSLRPPFASPSSAPSFPSSGSSRRLAVVNLLVTGRFPERAAGAEELDVDEIPLSAD